MKNTNRRNIKKVVTSPNNFEETWNIKQNVFQIRNYTNNTLYINLNQNVSASNFEIFIPQNVTRNLVIPDGVFSLFMFTTGIGNIIINSYFKSDITPKDLDQTTLTELISAVTGNVSVVSPLPNGGNTIGKVILTDGVDDGAVNNDGSINVRVGDGVNELNIDANNNIASRIVDISNNEVAIETTKYNKLRVESIDFNHNKVHQEKTFVVYQSNSALGAGATILYQFLIPLNNFVHFKFIKAWTESIGQIEMWVNPTGVVNGSTAVNKSNLWQKTTPVSSGITVYNDPNIAGIGGSKLLDEYFGGSSGGLGMAGIYSLNDEIVVGDVSSQSNVIIKFTNHDPGAVKFSTNIKWYE